MVKRVPGVTSTGAFTGKVLDWLDERYGGSGTVTGTPEKVPGVTIDGAFTGNTLNWLDTRYGGSGAVTGLANRLPAVNAQGGFSGNVLAWLDARYGAGPQLGQYVLPTFTLTVDPRDYLGGGETWTGVADIRAAFQAALNAAHTHAFASENNTVEFIIPPGVGKLTSMVSQAPINYDSTVTGTRLPRTIGFGLRPNMPGRIVFHGTGGRSEASTIQLSSNAHCLFYANTDGGTSGGTAAGYTWTKVYPEKSGNQGMRPTSLMSFQNYDFVGFCVDNKDALGDGNVVSKSHVIFGCTPVNWRQPYVSFYNLNHSDIRAKGFDPNPSAEEAEVSTQLLFSYRTKHTTHHEPTDGVGPNVWGNWNLETLTGRQAAFNAKWTFMQRMNFYDIEAINSTRAIHVTSDRTSGNNVVAQWFDEINLYRCLHTQPQPYTYWAPQTSFFIGAGGMGGVARAVDCVSENVGDNPIEMGAFQNRIITNFTSVNARLPGILLTNTQSPPDPETAMVTVDGYTFTVSAEAIATSPRARGFEFDTEGDGTGIPINLTVRNATMIIDGGTSKQNLSQLIRKYCYGWQLDGPVKKLDVDGLNLTVKNVATPSIYLGAGNGSNRALDKVLPLVLYKPSGFNDLQNATCIIKNVSLSLESWATGATTGSTSPVPSRVVGVLPVTSGTFTLDTVSLAINDVAGVQTADVVTVGAHQTEWARANGSGSGTRPEFFYTAPPSSFPAPTTGENSLYDRPGGQYVITNVTATRTGTSQPATRRLLVVGKQNPYASLNYSSINASGWGSGAVTLSSDIVPNDTFSETEPGSGLYYWTQRNTTVTV